jgi:hypothetical protein
MTSGPLAHTRTAWSTPLADRPALRPQDHSGWLSVRRAVTRLVRADLRADPLGRGRGIRGGRTYERA